MLVDPDDVAAGYATRMRWRNHGDWITPTGGRTRPWFPMNWQKLFVFGYRAGGVQVLYAAENRPCRTRCVGCSTAPRAAGVCRAQRVQESKQRAFSIAASLVSRVRYLSI